MKALGVPAATIRATAYRGLLVALVVLLFATSTGPAAATSGLSVTDLTQGLSPEELVSTLLGPSSGAVVSNVTFTGVALAGGQFTGGAEIVGFEGGIILGSGQVSDVVGPNDSDYTTTSFGTAGDADLDGLIPGSHTWDAAKLEFDFECPDLPVVSFQYVFVSEEYNEYTNSRYNNVFGFFLNGTNIALLPDGVTPVSINNVNGGHPDECTNGIDDDGDGAIDAADSDCTTPMDNIVGERNSNSGFFLNNDCSDPDGGSACPINIEADGLTVVLGAQSALLEGTNHIKLAIADVGDSYLDSWVLIKAGSFQCAPLGAPPQLAAHAVQVSVDEGQTATNTGTVVDPNGGQVALSASAGSVVNNGDGTWSWSLATTDGPDESQIVTISGLDASGQSSQVSFGLEVHNLPPDVGPIAGPSEPLAIGQPASFAADFADPGSGDTHTALWDWGDGTTTSLANVTSPTQAQHTYAQAGVYTVQLTVTDDDGESDTSTTVQVVIYEPVGGFVTGGGRIWSQPGAYKPDPGLTGHANFGFVSKCLKGANLPTGNTEFQFQVAGLNFHSASYEWLVVNRGGTNAQFKGRGTVNGSGGYRFMLWAGDGSPDTFRIRIWQDHEGGEVTLYDNGFGQPIDGGSIVIHLR